MQRFVRWLGGAGSMIAVLALLGGCTKSTEEENKVEFLEGNANEVTFLVGVSGDPKKDARDHCALYGKQAVLRDVDTGGTVWESYTTGSRPYVYYFDCL